MFGEETRLYSDAHYLRLVIHRPTIVFGMVVSSSVGADLITIIVIHVTELY